MSIRKMISLHPKDQNNQALGDAVPSSEAVSGVTIRMKRSTIWLAARKPSA